MIDYQDDVWSFFQNCWHLKDWVKNDDQVPADVKERIAREVHESPTLAIANDMANGTKHLRLHDPRAKAAYSHMRMNPGGENALEVILDVDGVHMIASVVARGCIAEWDRILSAEGLAIAPLGT